MIQNTEAMRERASFNQYFERDDEELGVEFDLWLAAHDTETRADQREKDAQIVLTKYESSHRVSIHRQLAQVFAAAIRLDGENQ